MALLPSWRDKRRTTFYGQHIDAMQILDMYVQLSAPLGPPNRPPRVPNVQHPLFFT